MVYFLSWIYITLIRGNASFKKVNLLILSLLEFKVDSTIYFESYHGSLLSTVSPFVCMGVCVCVKEREMPIG